MITVGAEAGHAGVVVGGHSAGVDVIGSGGTLLVVVQVLSVKATAAQATAAQAEESRMVVKVKKMMRATEIGSVEPE